MNRLKYILAAGLLISLMGLAVGQVDNNTTVLDDNDTNVTTDNETNQTNDTDDDLVLNDTDNETNDENVTTTDEEINETLETVILASNENYADSLMSGPISEEWGIPVLITDGDQLSNRASDVIEDANVENVAIVGGPSVIPEEVEQEVEDEVDATTRLWGLTQVGTSAELNNFFWEESDTATVLNYQPYEQNDSYQLLSAAKEQAKMEGQPLIVTSGENISNESEQTLEDLNVDEVDLYTTLNGEAENQLEDMNIDVNTNEGDIEELVEDIQNDVTEGDLNNSVHFVAADNWEDTISAPAYLDGPSIGIYDEDDISDSIEFLNDTDISEAVITGDGDLTDEVEQEIEDEQEDIEISTFTGSATRVSANLVTETAEAWNDAQSDFVEDFENQIDSDDLEDELENLQDRANETDNQTSEIEDALDEAEEAIDDDELLLAKMRLAEARSELDKQQFFDWSQSEIEERVNEQLGIDTAGAAVEEETNATNDTENMTNTTDGINLTS